MKKYLLLLLFPISLFGQSNIIEQSNSNTQTNNRGGFGVAKVQLLPIGNHDALYEFTRYKSRIQYNDAGNFIEFHNGTDWQRLVDVAFGTSNYKPLSYVPSWAEITGKPDLSVYYLNTNPNNFINQSQSRTAISLTTTGSGASTYNPSTGVLNIPTPSNTGTVSVGLSSTDFTVSGSPITTSGNITVNLNATGVSSGSYRNLTVDAKGRVTAGSNPTFNTTVSRTLNSNYTISSTLNSRVYYTIRISYNVTVLLGSTGAVSLQYSTNSGSTWITVSTISNSLNLGLALTGYNDFVLSGEIPANALVRLNSTATNATNTLQTATEITY